MGWTDTGVCLTHPEGVEAPDALVQALQAEGVERAWVFGYAAVKSHDFRAENDKVLSAAKRHPGALVPIALVNPFTAEQEVDALIAAGFKGIKILSGWGNWLTIDNIRRTLVPVAKKLAAHKLHLSIALEGNFPMRGGSVYLPLLVREACPEVALVLDHCWSRHTWLDYLAIAEEDPSLWFALNELPPRMVKDIVERLGTGRLVLGSWYPEHSPALIVERIRKSIGGEGDALKAVFAANAARILSGQHAAQATTTQE